jgi:hypothetical protein
MTAYPNLRESLAPNFVEVSDEQLDSIVAQIYGQGVTAEDVEAFWSDVGRGFQSVGRGAANFARQAAPVVSRALPSIAQGAMSGAALGPWGALAGAVAGGASGIMSQSRDPTLRGIGGAIGGATQLAGSFTGGGAVRNLAGLALGGGGGRGGRGGFGGAIGQIAGGAFGGAQRGGAGGALGQQGGAAGAIGQAAGALAPQIAGMFGGGQGFNANALMGLLSRPETLRALSSAALGPYGRAQIPIGQQHVPVQSILGALGNLAGRAAAEAEIASEQYPEYYFDSAGELVIDPADADQRTFALLELYAGTPSPYEAAEAEADYEAGEADEAEYTTADAVYDEWLLANETEWTEDQEEESYV